MIPLKCIVEYAILQGQSYDLGKDFVNFQRTVDGTVDRVKEKFEQSINAQLKGKRVRARASKGYKQYEKDYDFEVSRVTIDDYYDNYVVVAHDETGQKPKEYFLKPGSKIQILGPGTSGNTAPTQATPTPPKSRSQPPTSPRQPMARPSLAQPSSVVKEQESNNPTAYSIESIIDDITPWIHYFIRDTRIGAREFVKSLGWEKINKNGNTVAVYNAVFPTNNLKRKLTKQAMTVVLDRLSKKTGSTFKLINIIPSKEEYKITIKKITPKKSHPTL